MTIKRIDDSFRSGEDRVYEARPVSFECGIAPRDARRTGARAASRLSPRGGRKDLDPSFYPDLATFRAAVADGTVDVAKGCRNMAEYHQSLEGGRV